MTNRQRDQTRKTSVFVTIIFILVGIISILLAELGTWPVLGPDGSWQRKLLDSLGVFIISVLAVSWLYEKFLIEEHFSHFRQLIHEQIRMMDTVQSKCLKLGIERVFETRSDFQLNYPFAKLINLTKQRGRILCVGRSLFHLLNMEAEIEAGLKKGIQFDLACLDPAGASGQMHLLTQTYPADIESGLISLKSITDWVQEQRPEGGIELRHHQLYLPNSILAIETDTSTILIWDLSFGRDLTYKRVVLLKPAPGNLGQDLLERYSLIWDNSECKFKIQNGIIEVDNLS